MPAPPTPESEAAQHNRNLVEYLTEQGILYSPAVARAFLRTPRHRFLPGLPLDRAYANRAVPTKIVDEQAVSSASQPAMIAIMLEQLALRPGHNVLEIGAGTGYNAALMSQLVGPSGHVVTIDIDEDLVAGARENLASMGIDNVQAICADGGYGFPERAPYDRIILTVGAVDVTPHWWEQLAPRGRMVLPLEIGPGQMSMALDRVVPADGVAHLESASVRDCAFIRLRGEYAGSTMEAMSLGAEPGLEVMAPKEVMRRMDPATLYAWLHEQGVTWRTGVSLRHGETIQEGLGWWMTLRDPDLAYLTAYGDMADRHIVPPLIVRGDEHQIVRTCFLHSPNGVAALTIPPTNRRHPPPLHVLQLGPDPEPGQRMVRSVQSWHEHGRPTLDAMRIRIYPQRDGPGPSGVFNIDKGWTRLVIDWPGLNQGR